jgi:hypothetical protein
MVSAATGVGFRSTPGAPLLDNPQDRFVGRIKLRKCCGPDGMGSK